METGFLDRLANQLKVNKSATCRRAIQRILVRIKEHCESGQYKSTTEAENEFRRLVELESVVKTHRKIRFSPYLTGFLTCLADLTLTSPYAMLKSACEDRLEM